MGFVKDYKGLLVARAFLGIAEGGLFPGVYVITCCCIPLRETNPSN